MNAQANFSDLLTEAEAAGKLRLCPRTLRKYRKSGDLDFILFGGAIRYSLPDLERFVDERRLRCASTPVAKAKHIGTISGIMVSDIAAARAKRTGDKRR